jgi:hypothetical protein
MVAVQTGALAPGPEHQQQRWKYICNTAVVISEAHKQQHIKEATYFDYQIHS